MRTHGENEEGTRTEPAGRRRYLIPGLAIVAVLGVAGGALAVSLNDGKSVHDPRTPAGRAIDSPPATAGAHDAADPVPPTAAPADPGGSTAHAVSPPSGGTTHFPSQPNSRFSRYTLGPDGRTLTAWFWGGACETNRLIVAADAPTSVAVRIETTPTADMCIDIAKEDRAQVTLPTPLGSRTVVDAETGAALTPGGNPVPLT